MSSLIAPLHLITMPGAVTMSAYLTVRRAPGGNNTMPEPEDNRDEWIPEETTPMTPSTTPSGASSSSQHGRFLPGTRFGKRYRIVGLLGRGGMGEVYRADDLELNQEVALKFLPAGLGRNEAALTLLRNEVRVARQVRHPNVCAVYDIGEVDGQYFVSMEYVDGEDLASLLRRIGRVPREKGTDIVEQLAAGLAAAHDKGVLHRDLKPANIMIDGKGRVRIMDFGLAGFTEELHGTREPAGTLSYMAPEHLEGQGVSMRSDVFSLGLLMYELLTGRRAFEGKTIDKLRDSYRNDQVQPPSTHVSDLDPAVDRTVMWCLEKDASRRPGSARSVAAALPSGDPLAAAIAAGETPSPEMLAAAGGRGGGRPSIAALGFLVVIAGFIAVALLNNKVTLFRLAAPDKPPVVLADKAREILVEFGGTDDPVDRAYGMQYERGLMAEADRGDSAVGRWARMKDQRPTPYMFWYRQAPRELIAEDRLSGTVSSSDPSPLEEHTGRIFLDASGRLDGFRLVPAALERDADMDSAAAAPADWGLFFEHAGLDISSFDEVMPIWRPSYSVDERMAWDGVYPEEPYRALRIEAGSYRGRPVYFQVFDLNTYGWLTGIEEESTSIANAMSRFFRQLKLFIQIGIVIALFSIPGYLTFRNISLGRADVDSALLFGATGAILQLLSWTLSISHSVNPGVEVNIMISGVIQSVSIGVLLALGYIAAEPHLRRYWPDVLISWTRLSRGRLGDPLVARDILAGAVVGTCAIVLYKVALMAPTWFGAPMYRPETISIKTLLGGRLALGEFFTLNFLLIPWLLAVIILFFLLIRNRKAFAITGAFLLFAISVNDADFGRLNDPAQAAIFVADLIAVIASIVGFVRFGLLAVIVGWFFYIRLSTFPVTLDSSAWYSGTSTVLLLALAAIALYAAIMSARGYKAQGPIPPDRQAGNMLPGKSN